ncbi:hypothetical protein ACI2VG_03580, partial [Ralstonia nicotianae]
MKRLFRALGVSQPTRTYTPTTDTTSPAAATPESSRNSSPESSRSPSPVRSRSRNHPDLSDLPSRPRRKAEMLAESIQSARDRETLINGVREWNREPSCSRFPHRGKEVPIEHVFRRFRVVPGALCALRTECFQGWPATV